MDLLNLDEKQFTQQQRESFVDPDLYTPDPAKGQQGVYKSVGRFLPWHKNPNISKLRKNSAMLTNPLSKDKLGIDCPSTVNKPSVLWALDKMLKDRENNKIDLDMVKEIRESFSRYLNFYSPFYIFKDPQFPALENQVKILSFGITLDRLIQKELNPEDADLNPNARKINPYSLTEGKDFLVVIKKKSKRFKDYDGCKFLDDVVPFRFFIGADRHIVTLEELQQTGAGQNTPIAKFLVENTPNLEKYGYREWTDDTYRQVAAYLKAIIPYQGFMKELIDNTREDKMKQMLIDATSGYYGAPQSAQGTIIAPAVMTEQAAQPAAQVAQPAAQAAQPAAQVAQPAVQPQQPSAGINLIEPQVQQPAAQVQQPAAQPQVQQPVIPPATGEPKKLDENAQFEQMLAGL